MENYKLIKTVDKLEKDVIELQREVSMLKQQNQELVDMLRLKNGEKEKK